MKYILAVCLLFSFPGLGISQQLNENRLIPPILLENQQRLDGNPLATYVAMLEKQAQYLRSPFADIYKEQKYNIEQFMGVAYSDMKAMSLEHLKITYEESAQPVPENFSPINIISLLNNEADAHQVIIYGEEHHLPQTRSIYEEMLEVLWNHGFRYLAAETFTSEVEKANYGNITPSSGYYVQDPVYANALRFALNKGYKLISYDNNEEDRDKAQAENIYKKVFEKDPSAKVFIIAGRGHIAEYVQSGDWKPMGFRLKELTGIDPLTLYAPTMSDRLVESEKNPLYRYAVENKLLNGVTIFQDSATNTYLGQEGGFDAYVFFPPPKLINGRPDWLFTIPGRKSVEIRKEIFPSDTLVLIQAHRIDDPDNAVPVDQLLVKSNSGKSYLALPKGEFKIRAIDTKGNSINVQNISVR